MSEKRTPLMDQYFRIRASQPDAVLLFQVGDFYELFFDDAIRISAFLGLTLTKRGKCDGKDIPLCGIPIHTVRHYLAKLVKGGFRVAICDQLGEPQPGTLVERAITQVLTPGTLTDSALLDAQSSSYLLSCVQEGEWLGLVFGEILSAQLFATVIPAGALRTFESEMVRFFPSEVVLPASNHSATVMRYCRENGYWVSVAPALDEEVRAQVRAQLASSLGDEVFSTITDRPALAAGMVQLQSYIGSMQRNAPVVFRNLQLYEPDDYLIIDAASARHLELVQNTSDGGRQHTLLETLDHTKTAMGARLLKKWLLQPLVDHDAILQRQEAVTAFTRNQAVLERVQRLLGSCGDLERIVGRIALRRANQHDYGVLAEALKILDQVSGQLARVPGTLFIDMTRDVLGLFNELRDVLAASLATEQPGSIIKAGFDAHLDELRAIAERAQYDIAALESREIARTGINSLKVRYNSISGYAIEITKTHSAQVPADYIRQQTLTNRERYITSELVALERNIDRAAREMQEVEQAVFERVIERVLLQLTELRALAQALAQLDVLVSFASCAYEYGYVAPTFGDTQDILIDGGRHPVVERALQGIFTPNDTTLTSERSLWVITGPNMGGKSTYLRQVALICLMAQCGSFVPARAAQVPILDRIFTRIGAGDQVSKGKSTFLVEMEETAAICQFATSKSLVVLDEVGRGTSTHDGLAIAQAVVEYIVRDIGARCLFATHYHELTVLEGRIAGVYNAHLACTQTPHGIAFLHTIRPGAAERSFGIEVARLARLPAVIVARARERLGELHTESDVMLVPRQKSGEHEFQASFALQAPQQVHRLAAFDRELNAIDLNELSPRQALELVWKLKSI